MKLFGIVLLAGLVSLAIGIGLTIVASSIVPCMSDKAGCGLSEAYRLFLVPAEAIVAMIAFGISAAGQSREEPVKLTMVTLGLVTIFLALFAISSDLWEHRSVNLPALVEMLEILVVVLAVIATQWFVVRSYLRRQAA